MDVDDRHLRALLIERNSALRQVFTEALLELDFEVTAVEGRKDALDAVLRAFSGLDVFVVDLVDPASEGGAFLALLAGQPATFGVPVVVMTDGSGASGVPEQAASLVKPFGFEELRAAIEQAFHNARALRFAGKAPSSSSP